MEDEGQGLMCCLVDRLGSVLLSVTLQATMITQ
jgi:hypothetical protein